MKQKGTIPARRWILLGFFLFMAVCTILSRVYDSVSVPKVLTTTAKRKAVESVAEGTGTVIVKETIYDTAARGLRVGRVAVIPGSEVEKGAPLFWYDFDSMTEKKEELLQEIEQIDLNMEKEQISQENYSQMTQAETAQWELTLAQRELEEGQLEYEERLADHYMELERLKTAYEDQANLTEEELWSQQEKDWQAARQSLDSMKNSRDQELRAAERRIEDLEEELEGTDPEEKGTVRKLERSINRAREDLEDLKNSWEDRLDAARFQMDLVNDQEDRITSGRTSAQEARRETYEAAVKQQEEQIKAADRALQELKKNVEKAQWQLDAARKQDNAGQMSQEQRKRTSELTIRGMELDKKAKERELAGLETLIETGGEVTAREQGVVVDVEVAAGKTTTGEERISLAVGGCLFEGSFLKEEQKLTKGDTIQIAIPGTQRKKEAVIEQMNLMGDTEGIFRADLGDLDLSLGTVTSYTCTKQSDLFEKVIPIQGLRKDIKGYYCLVARPRASILGEEFRAERVEVQILYQGNREVAVEGAIFEQDTVIVGENQTIGEGSRIRPVSGF